MRRKLRYDWLLILAILICSTAANRHTLTLVPADVIPSYSCCYQPQETSRHADILYYLSHPTETTFETVDLSKYLQSLSQTLYGLHNINLSTPIAPVPKHQLAHFQSDRTIEYYIFALRKIVV